MNSRVSQTESDSRQAIQTWPDHSSGVVPSFRGVPSYMFPVASPGWICLPPDSTTNCHSLCHHSQTPKHGQCLHSVCPGKIWTHMPSHQQPSWAKWWRSCRTTHATESYWCTGLAQHTLDLGSSGNVQSDPTVPAQPGVSAIQSDAAQENDKSLKGDRSLCPVRALRYYLDRTSYLRQNKELVFFSFKKGFDKDISPATISSWIKQTVILCYGLSDQEALTLHQVKAHDVRAYAASKAFLSGISLE